MLLQTSRSSPARELGHSESPLADFDVSTQGDTTKERIGARLQKPFLPANLLA